LSTIVACGAKRVKHCITSRKNILSATSVEQTSIKSETGAH